MWGQSCPIVVLFLLCYFIISVSFHVFVYDIGCFVEYACESERVLCDEAKVLMIAIIFSSSVGMSIECLTGVSQVEGSRPDLFSCELNFIKALVYTLCEDNLILWLRYPSLIFHYQFVCSCVCIWCWLLCRYACDSGRVLCEEAKAPMIAILFSSSVGMSMEWLTGVSQVVGSRPDVFSCELNFIKALVYTLCDDNLVPLLCYSFSDISLSVCLFMCVYRMLVKLSICLRVGAGIVWGS